MANVPQVPSSAAEETRSAAKASTINNHALDGMLFNSHQVLDLALHASQYSRKSSRAIPSTLFQQCHGILLLHTIQAALVVGATSGEGLLLSHEPFTQNWSAPCAVQVMSHGWGMGIAERDVIVFIMNPQTMKALTSDKDFLYTLEQGRHASLTFGEGNITRSLVGMQNKDTIAYSYSLGFLAHVSSLDGAVVTPHVASNKAFYGSISPLDIFNKSEIPRNVESLHTKLNLLASMIHEPVFGDGNSEEYVALVARKEAPKEEFVLVQVAQTQTGGDDDSVDDNNGDLVEIIKQKHAVTCIAQTQTNETVVSCRVVQTQTDDDANAVVDDATIEKAVSNDIGITYENSETQTDELVVMHQEVQTQTGVNGDEVMVHDCTEKTTPNGSSATLTAAETQTEDVMDEAFIFSEDNEEFVVVSDGESDEEMEDFVVMSAD